MSQPKRYDCTESWGMDECMAWMDERVDGRYVEYSDYAALAAEKANDDAEYVQLKQDYLQLRIRNAALAAENERLRPGSFVTAVPAEQYERVIKAGDAMMEFDPCVGYYLDFSKLIDAWLAAKEGRDAK